MSKESTLVSHTEVGMALIRTDQSLEQIEQAYRHGDKGNMVLRSYYMLPYQLKIIDILAQETGKGKAEIVRDLVDEWCEMKLREAGLKAS